MDGRSLSDSSYRLVLRGTRFQATPFVVETLLPTDDLEFFGFQFSLSGSDYDHYCS